MLEELYPKDHRRFSALPILGSALDGFTRSLLQSGFSRKLVRRHTRSAMQVEQLLREQGCLALSHVGHEHLRACVPVAIRSWKDKELSSTVRRLEEYLAEHECLLPRAAPAIADRRLIEYAIFLREVRGLAPVTITRHLATAAGLLGHCAGQSSNVATLSLTIIEDFIRVTARRVGRESMLHLVAELRSFLRFLALRGQAPLGLDTQIDSPRVFREEKLPKSLPWETVQSLLAAIDRSTSTGKRDYAMLLLMATYGLRACDVVALRLDDIEWRAHRLRVVQRKTAAALWLPLTDLVAEGLLSYLRDGRPRVHVREIFVRHCAPDGILKATAVADVFQAWSRRSGLEIPFQGAHCLRHSYAVHLLRQGTPLKTIGDILGHRSAESTCVYLRLAVDDLREVALNLPPRAAQEVPA
jgi:integrase/recombinase XerD